MKVSKCCKDTWRYRTNVVAATNGICNNCDKECQLIDQPESKEENWEKEIKSGIFQDLKMKNQLISYIKQLLSSQKQKLELGFTQSMAEYRKYIREELIEELKKEMYMHFANCPENVNPIDEMQAEYIISLFNNKLKL